MLKRCTLKKYILKRCTTKECTTKECTLKRCTLKRCMTKECTTKECTLKRCMSNYFSLNLIWKKSEWMFKESDLNEESLSIQYLEVFLIDTIHDCKSDQWKQNKYQFLILFEIVKCKELKVKCDISFICSLILPHSYIVISPYLCRTSSKSFKNMMMMYSRSVKYFKDESIYHAFTSFKDRTFIKLSESSNRF